MVIDDCLFETTFLTATLATLKWIIADRQMRNGTARLLAALSVIFSHSRGQQEQAFGEGFQFGRLVGASSSCLNFRTQHLTQEGLASVGV